MKSIRVLIVDYDTIVDNKLCNYLNCFRYLDGDIPIAFVNTRTK